MFHGKFHALPFIRTDEEDVFRFPVCLPVHENQGNGETLVPRLEFGCVEPDRHRAAETDSVQTFQIVMRQDFNPEVVPREFPDQFRQHHFHIRLHRIDQFIGRDDDNVFLLAGKTGLVSVFPGDCEDLFADLVPDVRMMAEHTRDGGDGDSGFFGNFLYFHALSVLCLIID